MELGALRNHCSFFANLHLMPFPTAPNMHSPSRLRRTVHNLTNACFVHIYIYITNHKQHSRAWLPNQRCHDWWIDPATGRCNQPSSGNDLQFFDKHSRDQESSCCKKPARTYNCNSAAVLASVTLRSDAENCIYIGRLRPRLNRGDLILVNHQWQPQASEIVQKTARRHGLC